MHFQLVRHTSNAKVGKGVTITNSDKLTCPPACPFKAGNGCYAESGFHTNLNWTKLSNGERGSDWADFIEDVSSIGKGKLWRHNVSGDLVGENDKLDAKALAELVSANTDKRGFTYTHYPPTAHNIKAIRAANAGGFTVNLSANSITHAVKLKTSYPDLPVAAVVPSTMANDTVRVGGHKIVICPATYKDEVTCKTCKLCSVPDRDCIVGFPSHGTQLKKADLIASTNN